jgi:hypothetical protein
MTCITNLLPGSHANVYRAFSFIARHNILSTQANKTVRPRIAGGTLALVIRALTIYGSVAAIDRPLVFQFRNPSSRFNRRPTTMRSSSGTHAPVYLDCKRAPNVRFGSKADICSAKRHVRFTPSSGHWQRTSPCPFCANSGHRVEAVRSRTCIQTQPTRRRV